MSEVKKLPPGVVEISLDDFEKMELERAKAQQLTDALSMCARLTARVKVLEVQLQSAHRQLAAYQTTVAKDRVEQHEQKIADKVAGDLAGEARQKVADAAANANHKLNS